jgi:hypothetical protein
MKLYSEEEKRLEGAIFVNGPRESRDTDIRVYRVMDDNGKELVTWKHGALYPEYDKAPIKLPNMTDSLDLKPDMDRQRLYHSPEGHTWTLAGILDKALIRNLEAVTFIGNKEDADFQRLKAYNFLSTMRNEPPLYFRDTVFSIAYEKYVNHKGEKSIAREIANVLWTIRHLRNYGFPVQYAFDRLQGMLKTNRSVSMFHSDHIDAMINAYEREAEYKENYGVVQSDYVQPIGDTLSVTDESESIGVTITLDQLLYNAVYDYITGLNVLVISRLQRKADMGFKYFTMGGAYDDAYKIYSHRFFNGFLRKGYIGKIRSSYSKANLTKKEFLAYAYLCFNPNTVTFTTSIDLRAGILSPGVVEKPAEALKVELIKHKGESV